MFSSSSTSSSSLPPRHGSGASSQPSRSSAPPVPLASPIYPALSPSSLPPSGSSASPSSPALLQPPTTYFCYLLRSLSPKHSSHTYIGFTTSPLRRLRQHNGLITAGAWRTSRKRPWEVVCVVYGFTSKVVALQFEWQWTYPRKSKRMRVVMGLRRWATGARGKVETLYALLCSAPWRTMPLHVRFVSTDGWALHDSIVQRSAKERKEWEKRNRGETDEEREAAYHRRHIYALPEHVSITAGPLEELDYYRWRSQKRGRQKKREADAALDDPTSSVTPRGDEDDGALFDDDAVVSGEESLNSGDSDNDERDARGLPDGVDSPAIPMRRKGRKLSSPKLSPGDSGMRITPKGPPVASRLRCGLCLNTAEMADPRSAGFFSGCDQCAFVGHLQCIALHILRQMAGPNTDGVGLRDVAAFPLTQAASIDLTASPALVAPQRSLSSTSSPMSSARPSLPASLFSAVSPSLPLIPPPSTGSCPSCRSPWSYPLLVDRCRFMHVDGRGKRGGDVWYDEADEFSMAALMREWAGRGGEDKRKRKEEEKRQRDEAKEQRKRLKRDAAQSKADERKARADSSTTSVERGDARASHEESKRSRQAGSDSGGEMGGALHNSDATPGSASERKRKRKRSSKEKENERSGKAQSPAGVLEVKTVSRRVEMYDGPPPQAPSSSSTPSLFASSQPAALPSWGSSCSAARPVVARSVRKGVVTLSDYEDADDDGESHAVAAFGGRTCAVAKSAGRKLDGAVSGGGSSAAAPSVQSTAHGGNGHRDWVHLDEDDDVSEAVACVYGTDVDDDDDDVRMLSLAERVKQKAQSAGLGVSLGSIR